MCSGDGGYINRMFAASREYRDSFSFASIGPVKNMYMIYCDVIDENGAIATIATILAVHGISIKNIRIVHNREHDQGALAIEFYKKEAMDSSIRILRHHRYRVTANE
jgi:prephenate dehydrogenase